MLQLREFGDFHGDRQIIWSLLVKRNIEKDFCVTGYEFAVMQLDLSFYFKKDKSNCMTVNL